MKDSEDFESRPQTFSLASVCFQGLLVLGLLLGAFFAEAKTNESNPPSTVAGVAIRNFHLLAEGEGRLYRGAEPLGREAEAAAIGVDRVIIYKKQNKKEVDREIARWKDLGVAESHITHLPATWKDVDAVRACEQAVTALQLMKDALETKGAALFFHCTQGEDRTGMLAGLYRMLNEGWTLEQAFKEEMCGRGYEAGSPTKPGFVVGEIRKGLTPLFLRLARLEKEGKFGWSKLNLQLCRDIEKVEPIDDPKNWRCS